MRQFFQKSILAIFSLSLLIFCSLPLIAEDGFLETRAFQFSGAGARPLGMGGAFIAVGGDPTSGFWNPAGLATIHESQITISYNIFGTNKNYMDGWSNGELTLTTIDDKLDISGIDYIAITLPFRQSELFMVHQVSFHQVNNFAFSGAFSQPYTQQVGDFGITRDHLIDSSGSLQALSYTIAFEILDNLHLGISYNHYIGGYNYTNTFTNTYSLQNDSILETIVSDGDWEFLGDNFTLGILFKPVDMITIGGVFKNGYSLKTKYDRTDGYTLVLADSEESYDLHSEGKAEIDRPAFLGMGAAVTPIEGLTVALDYTISNWTAEKKSDTDYDRGIIEDFFYPYDPNNVPYTADDLNYPTFTPPSLANQSKEVFLRFGIEYFYELNKDTKVALRGGFWQQQAIFKDPFDESINFTGISFGAGLYMDFIKIDAAYITSSASSLFLNIENGPEEDWTDSRFFAQISYIFEAF